MTILEALNNIESGAFLPMLTKLYGSSENTIKEQSKRYKNALKEFSRVFPERQPVHIFSAPGRTEIGGNHTDHQHGCVLAAAVDLDVIAIVSFHNDGVIRIKSEGYEPFEIDLCDISPKKNDYGSAAITRGIAAKFDEIGAKIGGFDAYVTSNVLSGSGISSSAAFETLIGTIIDTYYNGSRAGAIEIAKIGQFAENVYFGKNSGLMDQMVSSVGGLLAIDFEDTASPKIDAFNFDFESHGYSVCITDTKGSHADLTDDYIAIRSEMEGVANAFGHPYLRPVDKSAFYSSIPALRKTHSDRAILRASHFFSENARAIKEAEALKEGNVEKFLALVNESGESSALLLQNLYSLSKPTNQEINLAITMSKRVLGGKGAVRVHGGGFAGTIQAFVPLSLLDAYTEEMDRIFGLGSCKKLRIRPVGGIEITKEDK